MLGFYRNIIPNKSLLFVVLILMTMVHCSPDAWGGGVKIRGVNQRLIARDISNVPPIWCGSDLVYVTGRKGVDCLYDVKSGKKRLVENNWGFPIDCSPDGKWLVYLDKRDVKYDRTAGTAIVDAWRYEIATGRLQKFAITDDVSPAFSPSGRRLFMGARPSGGVKMPEPMWELFWSEAEESTTGFIWLNESNESVVIGYTVHPRKDNDRLVVEVLKPERRTLYLRPPGGLEGADLLSIDDYNRFYLRACMDSKCKHENLSRCTVDIAEEVIKCEMVLENIENLHIPSSLLGEDTLIFSRMGERCVRAQRFGEDESYCIVTTENESGNFAVTSPDGKWLAFTVSREDETKYSFQDMYVVELLRD